MITDNRIRRNGLKEKKRQIKERESIEEKKEVKKSNKQIIIKKETTDRAKIINGYMEINNKK